MKDTASAPQDQVENDIAAGLRAWKLLQAATAAQSLEATVRIGRALALLRQSVLEAIGQDIPSGPKYSRRMRRVLHDAGFEEMGLKLMRAFLWVSEHEQEASDVFYERRTEAFTPSAHPSALRAAVAHRRRQAGRSNAQNAKKNLPVALVRERMAVLGEDERLDQLEQLAAILRSMSVKYLPEALQESDVVIANLAEIRRTVRVSHEVVEPEPVQKPDQPSYGIMIRGVHYLNAQQAAAALGIPLETIRSARKRGDLDRVGLRGAVPVAIRGVEYPSVKAAAEALGVSEQTVSEARQRGTLDRVGLIRKGITLSVPTFTGAVQ